MVEEIRKAGSIAIVLSAFLRFIHITSDVADFCPACPCVLCPVSSYYSLVDVALAFILKCVAFPAAKSEYVCTTFEGG